MATYSLEELLNRWRRDEMEVEQMLGQILQHLLRLEKEWQVLKQLLLECLAKLKASGQAD